MYDIAIIGGGPAGVSAAINAKLLNKSFIWLSGGRSKKVERAALIKNYPALPDVTGEELSRALFSHAEGMGVQMQTALVTGIYKTDDGFSLTAGADVYESKTVILCTGVTFAKPIKGEEEFLGRGVSYCATCDGFLYRGKNIAVVCYDKSLEHEAEYLLNIAGKAVIVPLYKDCGIKSENAEIIKKPPLEIAGDMRVKRIVFADEIKDVDGVFVLKSTISPNVLLHGLKTDGGHISVDRNMRTSVGGVFAAGDCTGRPYQYVKSAGEGNIALHSAAEYLKLINN